MLYCHRPTRVTSFLSALLNNHCIEILKFRSPEQWNAFENSWVNFSHFSEDIAHKAAQDSLTQDGVFAAFLRGRAIVCRKGQKGIDLVIPMVVFSGDRNFCSDVDSSDISAIIVQVKNKKADTCHFSKEKLDIKYIEGLEVSSKKPYIGIWMSFRTSSQDLTFDGGSSIPGANLKSNSF